jgi:hypothetical protein
MEIAKLWTRSFDTTLLAPRSVEPLRALHADRRGRPHEGRADAIEALDDLGAELAPADHAKPAT